jgi:hypothetical protein
MINLYDNYIILKLLLQNPNLSTTLLCFHYVQNTPIKIGENTCMLEAQSENQFGIGLVISPTS